MSINGDPDPSKIHPHSTWNEPWTHRHLTLFDQHRAPHPINQSETKRRISLKVKDDLSEFRCSVCMGWMKNTSVVMGCLHRFCAECVEESLRKDKQNRCPKCRIHIPSRRSLRPDPRFDMIIEGILGNVDELEAKEEFEMQETLITAIGRGRQQKGQSDGMGAPQRKRKLSDSSQNKAALSDSSQASSERQRNRPRKSSKKVDFLLSRDPLERRVDALAKPELVVSGEATIALIKLFLSRKLSHAPPEDFRITVLAHEEQDIALDDDLKLSEVSSKSRVESLDDMLSLRYRLQTSADQVPH